MALRAELPHRSVRQPSPVVLAPTDAPLEEAQCMVAIVLFGSCSRLTSGLVSVTNWAIRW